MKYILLFCVVALYIFVTTIYSKGAYEGFAPVPPSCPPVPACPPIPACPNPIPKIAKAIDAANSDILKRQGEIGCGGPRITDPLSPEMSATLAGKVGQCYEINYVKNTLLKNISDSLK